MKKKNLIMTILLFLTTMYTTISYADLIFLNGNPGRNSYFQEYNFSEKLAKFSEYIQAPVKNFTIILLILFVVLGISLLLFRLINKQKEEEVNNLVKLLRIIFVIVCILLSLVSIYIGCQSERFGNLYGVVPSQRSGASEVARGLDDNALKLYIIYIAILIISVIVGIVKKSAKPIYITVICLTILILANNLIDYSRLDIGYYT